MDFSVGKTNADYTHPRPPGRNQNVVVFSLDHLLDQPGAVAGYSGIGMTGWLASDADFDLKDAAAFRS